VRVHAVPSHRLRIFLLHFLLVHLPAEVAHCAFVVQQVRRLGLLAQGVVCLRSLVQEDRVADGSLSLPFERRQVLQV